MSDEHAGAVLDAIIVGGGITGLAAAHYLQESAKTAGRPLTYAVLESDSRVGGKILTSQVEGFTVEGGPDCFLSQKPWAAELCRQLGIGDRLIGTNDERRRVFVLNRGRLTALPDGVMLIIPTKITPFVTSGLISWRGKLRMGMDIVLPPRRHGGDESVGDFVRRRLGTEALEKIAEPLMSGIHVSDPEQQSLLATFPRFRDLEVKHGSLIRGMLARRMPGRHPAAAPATGAPRRSTTFVTLRGGLGELIAALEHALTGGQIVTGCRVTAVERKDGIYQVRTAEGHTYRGRSLILASPAYVSAGLVMSLSSALAGMLAGIRYVSTATVSMGFSREHSQPLNGFGFVVPRREQRFISACTWTSTKFDHRSPAEAALVRSFVGGPSREHLVDLSDSEMLSRVSEDLQRIMGLNCRPDMARIYRWRKANPQYDVGHLDRVRQMRDLCAAQPGLFLAGSAFDGVGVPDCVRQGQQTAGQALAYLSRPCSS